MELRLNRGERRIEWIDKVVFATSTNKLPLRPNIDGHYNFEGGILHSKLLQEVWVSLIVAA